MPPRIAIVGAGPAGLTAALAAKSAGLDVTVFEQAPRFDPIGGGLLLHSNGLRVLNALGLIPALHSRMRVISQMTLERAGGAALFTLDYRTLDIPQAQGVIVMRHALEDCLLSAALAAGVPVCFGRRLEVLTVNDGKATLCFQNSEQAEFDIVIACDGVHSRTRAALGVPCRLHETGQAFLRGTGDVHTAAPILREIWGTGARVFGICPLPGDQTHFYCSVPRGQWAVIQQQDLGHWIESWTEFGADVVGILRAVPEWSVVNYSETSEVFLPHWYRQPVFFVGDAAHAMRPNLGQGANMAMVDAFLLARLLSEALPSGRDLDSVGHAYETLRRPFVTQVQTIARSIGVLAGWTSPPGRSLRDILLSLPQHVPLLQQRGALWTAGYNLRENRYF